MSISTLLDAVFAKKTQQVQSDIATYATLLNKQATDEHHWSTKDETTLIQLITSLGISKEQAMADAKTVETVANLTKLQTTLADAEKRNNLANEQLLKASADRNRVVAAANDNFRQANNDLMASADAVRDIINAKGEIKRLKASKPYLFTDAEPAT